MINRRRRNGVYLYPYALLWSISVCILYAWLNFNKILADYFKKRKKMMNEILEHFDWMCFTLNLFFDLDYYLNTLEISLMISFSFFHLFIFQFFSPCLIFKNISVELWTLHVKNMEINYFTFSFFLIFLLDNFLSSGY